MVDATMSKRDPADAAGTPDAFQRVHAYEAIENFRDFGGYGTGNGARIRPGRLFRSAHHALASDADLERLSALGLATVVDLRRPTERANQPSRRPAGWTGNVILNDLGDEAEPPHLAFLRQDDVSPATIQSYLHGYYRKAPMEERHVDLFSRALTTLAGLDAPILIHCTAGKDRTGMLAALIHLALGVHPDDVLADYVMTNEFTLTPVRMEATRQRLQEALGKPVPEEAVHAFLGVQAEHLETALNSIRAHHGSTDAYLASLGLGPREREQLAAHLLA